MSGRLVVPLLQSEGEWGWGGGRKHPTHSAVRGKRSGDAECGGRAGREEASSSELHRAFLFYACNQSRSVCVVPCGLPPPPLRSVPHRRTKPCTSPLSTPFPCPPPPPLPVTSAPRVLCNRCVPPPFPTSPQTHVFASLPPLSEPELSSQRTRPVLVDAAVCVSVSVFVFASVHCFFFLF